MSKHLVIALTVAAFFLSALPVRAVESVPNFPSCTQPTGTLKVHYPSGTHGIAGSSDTFIGSDRVYSLESGNLLQCFCPANGGEGIATNWWKVANFSHNDIEYFTKQSWVWIPNGALWGLDATQYLAKNSNFTCNGMGGASTSSGQVLGASVLGATGQAQQIIGLLVITGLSGLLFVAIRLLNE